MNRGVGFTVVELMVIIVVVAILVSVGVVGYGSWQRSIASKAVENDLQQAQSAVKNTVNFTNTYPKNFDELNESFAPSPDVSMSLTLSGGEELPVYINLTPTQNGVLFHEICGDLISDGYGKGTNQGNQEEQYISACNVYNRDEVQVNSAWTARRFKTPLSASALPNVVSSINYNDSWRPDRDEIEKKFYQTWHDRYLAQGGEYPITDFWDPWCTGACSWGTQNEPLPSPSSTLLQSTEYCIQASSHRYNDIVKHITSRGALRDGAC